MKKLKNFQKFALSAEQTNSIRGGAVEDETLTLTCHYGSGDHRYTKTFSGEERQTKRSALSFCSRIPSCAGCF